MAEWRPFRGAAVILVMFLLAVAGCGEGRGSGGQSSTEERTSEERSAEEMTSGERTSRQEKTGERTVVGAVSSYGDGSGVEPGSGLQASDTLVAGAKDRTGGPLVDRRIVSYYGHPLSGAMGVLGQYEPEKMIGKLKAQAKEYTRLDPDRPAIPTIELIASVAQPTPGSDGLYLDRTEPGLIEEYSALAEENDCLLLLDIQVGYSTIADEVEVLMPYLEREHVHLAIDPEYDMLPGEIPGEQLGSSTGQEIMAAARTLSRLVEEKDLPPKVLVVHQFRYDMILDKEAIKPVKNVEIVIHADGFGTPEQKFKKYDALVRDQPIQYGGFKLFYNEDYPLLSPKEVLEELEPNPAVVSYQ